MQSSQNDNAASSYLIAVLRTANCVGLLALGIVVSASGQPIEGIDPSVRRRFEQEAKDGWETLRSGLKGHKWNVRHIERWRDLDGKEHTKELVFACEQSIGDHERRIVKSEESLVSASNERYAFSVERNDAGWSLIHCKPRTADANDHLLSQLHSLISTTSRIWWLDVEPLLSDGNHELVVASSRVVGAKEIVRIGIRRIKGTARFGDVNTLYWADLLPSRHWAVSTSGVGGTGLPGGSSNLDVTVECKIADSGNGSVYPEHVMMTYKDKATGDVVESRETHVSVAGHANSDVAEFYLPYYGISESSVPILGGRGSMVRVVSGFAGVILLLVTGVLARKQYKSRTYEQDR